jgi:hypothetical protein
MDPVGFKIGDIVEVQMTATVVPIRDNRFKMLLQLRAIALLNSAFSQVSRESHKNIQQRNDE